MEILIDDIPESGLTIKADQAKDVWLHHVVRDVLGESFDEGDRAVLKVTLMRTDDDIDIIGDLLLALHPTCDRCLKVFSSERTISIHSHMTPLYENERQRQREHDEGADRELVTEDVEFSYYEGDRIHLDEIIAEQMVLAQPMKNLCSEDCKGLCQRCGKDLNEGMCECKDKVEDSRWAPLKNVKIQ